MEPLRYIVADEDEVSVTLHYPDGEATVRVLPGSILLVDRDELRGLPGVRRGPADT